MNVRFHLRRILTAERPDALLLSSGETDDLLTLCSRLGGDSMPRIFPVAGGFLIQPAAPMGACLSKTIRLRRLASNLYLPLNTELLPSLLEDELTALTRKRGLVFLPGGRVLTFDPNQPLPLSGLLVPGEHRRRSWQTFPSAAPLAEKLDEIILDLPPKLPDELLSAGAMPSDVEGGQPEGAGLGSRLVAAGRKGLGQAAAGFRKLLRLKGPAPPDTAEAMRKPRKAKAGPQDNREPPRPDRAGLGFTVIAAGAMGLGQGLASLGRLLGVGPLARLGASWMRKAVELAPRMSEAILGRREAALRALLRDFRLGNLERALRRALPLSEPGRRGGRDLGDTELPVHELKYSLGNVVGGPFSIWFGRFDVMTELQKEYRKAAEEAVRRGDYRRAAWIYGKLLRDYHLAAGALSHGGLHHDAAQLYLRVNDFLAAARSFEAAGEIDQALALYRQRQHHVHAADLLRRIGEEEAALMEYRLAAEKLVLSTQGYLAAGELMLTKAQRPDLALEYFKLGWASRRGANATACGLHIAELYADTGRGDQLLVLMSEAEECLAPWGNDVEASRFFNTVARLADRPLLTGVRDDVRDRALLALAAKLRQRASAESRPGMIVSSMLTSTGKWPAPLRHDAQAAFTRALQPSPQRTPLSGAPHVTMARLPVGTEVVTAVCSAPATGDVFVGFQDRSVICFRPSDSTTVELSAGPWPATSLAVDSKGEFAFVLRQKWAGLARLMSHFRTPDGHYEISQTRLLNGEGEFWLTPRAIEVGESSPGIWGASALLIGVWNGERLSILPRSLLGPGLDVPLPISAAAVTGAHLFHDRCTSRPLLFLLDPDSVWCYRDWHSLPGQVFLGWAPDALRRATVSWLQRDDYHIEVVGLRPNGVVRWSLVRQEDEGFQRSASCVSAAAGYRAATLVRAGVVAAVREAGIDWLRCPSKGFAVTGTTETSLPTALACFPSHPTKELIIVCADGAIARVSVPE
jgi:hypothetical protein